jgi:hypothetical protein
MGPTKRMVGSARQTAGSNRFTPEQPESRYQQSRILSSPSLLRTPFTPTNAPEARFGPVSVLPTFDQAKQNLFSECNGDIPSVKAALLKCLSGVCRHGLG